MQQIGIKSYCHIKNKKVYLDGKQVFSDDAHMDLKAFLKNIFRNFKIKYPKFFKMDEISKLGFLASEILLKDIDTLHFNESEIGIVFANSHSTLVTDTLHQESINDHDNFYPSPSVFVYTLPNIMIGEISIKHKFRGENAFYIFEHFNTVFVADYINSLFTAEKIKACLGGWVDQSANEYEAFVYWLEYVNDNEDSPDHMGTMIKELYEKL